MIGRLRGTLVERSFDEIIVDCSGVGYQVVLSAHSLAELPELGQEVNLRIYTQAQETRLTLYGFCSEAERQLFDLLITVKNVGPSTAIGILSSGPGPRALAEFIARENLAALKGIRGVGKKTAEMLVVELREKCEKLLLTWGASGDAAVPRPARLAAGTMSGLVPGGRAPVLEEVFSALVQLGWRPAEAERALGHLEPDERDTLETLLRQALRAMPR